MSKLTKTLVAAAVSGLVSTSAIAATDGCVDGYYATDTGKTYKLTVTGNKCDKYVSQAQMALTLSCGGEGSGANSGDWESTVFDFGDEGNGDGPYIASKPGRTLVMDQDGDGVDSFEELMDDYVLGFIPDNEGCSPDTLGYNDDTLLKKFEGKASKNGEKVKVRWDSEGTYDDLDKDKERKVKAKLRATLVKTTPPPVQPLP